MRPLRVVLIAVALTSVGATVASGQEPAPGLGIRLVEIPAARAADPRARSYIIDHLAPGSTIQRVVEVSNGTAEMFEAELYAGAAAIRGGSFVFGARGEENTLSKWVSVAPDRLRLAPGESKRATVTVRVPADAARAEYYAVLWAEKPAPPPPPDGGVTVASRVGIRLYVSAGTGAEPTTDFELRTFVPRRNGDGRPEVVITGCNTGGRAVDLTGELALTGGPGGVSASPGRSEAPVTLAPEQCGELPIRLDPALPAGPWDATAKLRSGTTERTAEARITFPERAGSSGEAVEAKEVTGTTRGRVTLAVAGVLLLVALVMSATFVLRRRRATNAG